MRSSRALFNLVKLKVVLVTMFLSHAIGNFAKSQLTNASFINSVQSSSISHTQIILFMYTSSIYTIIMYTINVYCIQVLYTAIMYTIDVLIVQYSIQSCTLAMLAMWRAVVISSKLTLVRLAPLMLVLYSSAPFRSHP